MLAIALPLRFILLIASAGALTGAGLMFWEGGAEIIAAVRSVISAGDTERMVIAGVMEATDKFLFGVVLVIFSFSIAFGFVFDLDPATRDRLPRWMRLDGIDELKHTFFEVILIYLVVDFATDVAESEDHAHWHLLVMPGAILLLAGAFRLMSSARPGPGGE